MKKIIMSRWRILLFFAALFLMAAGAVSAYTHDPEFDVLIAKKGAAARELFENPTLYREAQLRGMPCSPDDFQFLLDRPRTSVALAGKMHKSLDKYYISIVRPGMYHIDGGKELVGDMELVSDRPGKRLYYVTGYWKLIPGIRLNGRLAIVVEGVHNDPQGTLKRLESVPYVPPNEAREFKDRFLNKKL